MVNRRGTRRGRHRFRRDAWNRLVQVRDASDAVVATYGRDALGRRRNDDPIGFEAGDNNWYRYEGNDPGNRVDPSGLNPAIVIIPVVGGGIVLTAAQSVAAAFGLSILACLQNNECRAAMRAAISKSVNEIGETFKAILRLNCDLQHTLYHMAETLCSKCKTGKGKSFCERAARCSHALVNGTCWANAIALRLSYMVSGCDFVLHENFESHAKALSEKTNALKNCTTSASKNCCVFF